MNIQECRDFVLKHRPFCCGERVESSVYSVTNHWQHFFCRECNNEIKINCWPLYEDDIRDLKLNTILNEDR